MGEVLADGLVSKIFSLLILSFSIKSLKGVKHRASHLWIGIYKEADKNSPELPGIRITNLILLEITIQASKQAKIQGKGHRRSGGGLQGCGRHRGSHQ